MRRKNQEKCYPSISFPETFIIYFLFLLSLQHHEREGKGYQATNIVVQ